MLNKKSTEKIYIKNGYNPKQEKEAKKLRKVVEKAFSPIEITSIDIFGEDLTELINDMETRKEGKSEKELKKHQKLIDWYKNNYGEFIVTFNFNSHLQKLAWKESKFESKERLIKYTWTGILDFPVEQPFIFGRVVSAPRHKGGTYLFAEISDIIQPFYEMINEIQQEMPDLNITDLVEHLPFTDILSKLSAFEPMRKIMKNALLQFVDKKPFTNNEFIDKMNQNKKLVKTLKNNTSYGAIEKASAIGKVFFVSDVDINVVCFPCENISIIQLIEAGEFEERKNALGALNYLANYLFP